MKKLILILFIAVSVIFSNRLLAYTGPDTDSNGLPTRPDAPDITVNGTGVNDTGVNEASAIVTNQDGVYLTVNSTGD